MRDGIGDAIEHFAQAKKLDHPFTLEHCLKEDHKMSHQTHCDGPEPFNPTTLPDSRGPEKGKESFGGGADQR